MGKVWVKELTGGLDTRRLPETTPGGVLIKGENGHINSGGEFESRASFVKAYTLPADKTVGLAADATGLIAFGSVAAPTMPSGVTYQRLQKSTKVLTDVPSWDLYGGDVYAVAVYDDGTVVHFFDATEVTDWFDGRSRASFNVTGGESTTPSKISILVNGVDLIGTTVSWTTSNEATASAIASAINGHTSSPDYSATAVGTQVNIVAATSGAAPNGFAVTLILTDGFTTTPPAGLFMAGGVDSAAFVPGLFVKTVGSKVYAVSGGVLHFSGIQQPTKWTTDVTGAGFFDLSKVASGAEDLLAIANYQGFVAVFAETVIIIMFVDPDPDLVRETQVLQNTGTVAPPSVTEFGDADDFYLALSGLRSLRARDSSNSASTTDLGVPVDSLITAKLGMMTADERKGVVGLINPVDGRFWLAFPDGEIFVFSFYPNAKVSAWTTYIFTDQDGNQAPIDKAVVFGRRVYIRSGDDIYVYGGLDAGTGLTYDETVAKAHLPAFDGGAPTQKKKWRGIDAAVEGEWAVYAAQQPTDLTIRENVATLTETTYNREKITFDAECTHVSPQFESQGTGPHKLSSVVLHNDMAEDG